MSESEDKSQRASLPGFIRGLAGRLMKQAQRQKLSLFVQFLLDEGVPGGELVRHVEAGRDTPASLEPYLLASVGRKKWLAALALQYTCEAFDLENADIAEQVAAVVPKDLAKTSRVACVDVDENGMSLAMVNPDDEFCIAEVEARTDFKVSQRLVILDTDLTAFQDMQYNTANCLNASVREIVDDIIRQAIQWKASDIHIEPREDNLEVRFRKDGVLHDAYDVHKVAPKKIMIGYLKSALPVVVKNKAGASGTTMDIAEKQKPQDGRIYLPGRKLDMRVSLIPTVHGESIVIRLHRPANEEVDLVSLGFSGGSLRQFESLVKSPYGIILVSGPTGSGKTTTLYTVLRMLNQRESKILTIEDPVEYSLGGINQVQTNAAKGVSFASALRSFLRHDPDIIMVGEIRDSETARLAVEASLTGHLVLSTIHANDAVRTITRLRDLGVSPLLITSTCLATLAQRLVRVNCKNCLEKARFSRRFFQFMDRYEVPYREEDLVAGVGCQECNGTGYRGRTGIHELMVMTPELRELVLRLAPDAELEVMARSQGMRLLLQDALYKAAQGITTEAEVLRVTLADAGSAENSDEARSFAISSSVPQQEPPPRPVAVVEAVPVVHLPVIRAAGAKRPELVEVESDLPAAKPVMESKDDFDGAFLSITASTQDHPVFRRRSRQPRNLARDGLGFARSQ